MSKLQLAVVIGSTREGRFGGQVAKWFADLASETDLFEIDLVDLKDFGFPQEMGQGFPRMGQYPDSIKPFAERMAKADAFVFVTPEYNHGYPASLKSALDSIFAEWLAKPASFISYGGAMGGVRAIEQLRTVAAELHMVDIRDTLSIPFVFGAFENGKVKDENYAKSASEIVKQLNWWANTLKKGKEVAPYIPAK